MVFKFEWLVNCYSHILITFYFRYIEDIFYFASIPFLLSILIIPDLSIFIFIPLFSYQSLILTIDFFVWSMLSHHRAGLSVLSSDFMLSFSKLLRRSSRKMLNKMGNKADPWVSPLLISIILSLYFNLNQSNIFCTTQIILSFIPNFFILIIKNFLGTESYAFFRSKNTMTAFDLIKFTPFSCFCPNSNKSSMFLIVELLIKLLWWRLSWFDSVTFYILIKKLRLNSLVMAWRMLIGLVISIRG